MTDETLAIALIRGRHSLEERAPVRLRFRNVGQGGPDDLKPLPIERKLPRFLRERIVSLTSPEALAALRSLRRGIEKESLRVGPDLKLAQTPHPRGFGSSLTHPLITTDYSEALMEFITPASTSIEGTLIQLEEIHQFVHAGLGEELLWNASMPGALGPDHEIPVARYGDSNVGRMKTVYRVGLGYRYGRRMQTISGIHYNFSLPDALWPLLGCHDQDAINGAYFALIRNFRRLSWLLVYLFGASPVASRSFLEGRSHTLQPLGSASFHLPHATSLRMGDLGYQSSAQQGLRVPYDALGSYVGALRDAIFAPHASYRCLVTRVAGEYCQLSTSLLQLENEFYSLIRPKRTARRGETALSALAGRGVEYVEVRCLDVNPFLPLGIDAEQMRFLDVFLLFCLLTPSAMERDEGMRASRSNLQRVVDHGRQDDLLLEREGHLVPLQEWAEDLLDLVMPLATLLDRANGSPLHERSVRAQRAKVRNSSLTPSARILAEIISQGQDWSEFAAHHSKLHGSRFKRRPLSSHRLAALTALAEHSVAQQMALEAEEQVPFEQFLASYFDQYRVIPSAAFEREPAALTCTPLRAV